MVQAREKILDRARALVAGGTNPTVAQIAAAAGLSRASFYRAFESRDALLEALDVQPEPGARERILAAAFRMVGEQGLSSLSMDELASQSGVSRASLYRLFPGKGALFTALVRAYSPLEPVIALLSARGEEPPEVVMPEIARAIYRTVYAGGENRTGLLKALFFEVSSLAPDTEDAAREVIAHLVGSIAMYLATQMAAGRVRRIHPLLALQAFAGPIFFHLITRPAAERVLGIEIGGEEAVTELAEAWLRAMAPEEKR
jgi:AcrR family transcriptional regulator